MHQRQLWVAAKLAVRAYAKDPSERNAADVRLAWQRIRESESLAVWNGTRARWPDRQALFPYARAARGPARPAAVPDDGLRRTGT